MRVLLYGMQSSGASALALALAQKPDSLAFVDIWNMFAAPELETDREVVAKVVVTTAFSLEVHRRRFRPDVTVLVVRHPVDNYYSLLGKTYANESGLIDEKFAILEKVLKSRKGFDHVFFYEDFVFSPQSLIGLCDRMGWPITWDALLFRRTQREIQRSNAAACPGIHGRLKYGAGNVYDRGLLRDRVKFSEPGGKTSHLPMQCPSLFARYSAARADRGALWHLPPRALLTCSLETVVRALIGSRAIPRRSEHAGYRLTFAEAAPLCRLDEAGLVLCPGDHQRDTRLTISGLPGRPFNRIGGTAYMLHPRALGTHIAVRVEGEGGYCLGEHAFTLGHSAMRTIDVAFEPQVSQVGLTLSVRLADDVNIAADAEVCFQDLRLEQMVK